MNLYDELTEAARDMADAFDKLKAAVDGSVDPVVSGNQFPDGASDALRAWALRLEGAASAASSTQSAVSP